MAPLLSRQTGELLLRATSVGPKSSYEDFVDRFHPLPGSIASRNGESATLREERIGDRAYLVIARFANGRLAHLTLVDTDPAFGTSWEDSSEEKELARCAHHDAFLVSELGPPTQVDEAHHYTAWTVPWGRVFSSWDVRGGSNAIQIQYSPLETSR